ncbi:MAG: CBS domain-containing protein, partial [Actinobacteria bacterium]|nr:CBS domain-containing protein [Actinomycetota bacterium]
TLLADVCTEEVVTLSASDSVDDAVRLMSQHAVRRVAVVANGVPVGIVSFGDVVLEQDAVDDEDVHDALADISAAPPDDPSTEARPNASVGWEATLDVPPMPKANDLDPAGRRQLGNTKFYR